ncbi:MULTISPECIES: homogentisate 1,2-dioxygenase [Legionella]|uniref:Homogentisate 1,2-dioxygenase n=1 Tax=Legionella drozanskii LLAP-1 TaxID=1212489 RepID=A0A0W0TDX0_9GAMM|nr:MULTISPECIES: homogentisate 1,2-dioxygenase [Legionella]KTC93800.1 Homogentisate 1,2-dioxygenase [Legionella drozanskii LLAP-1]PJE13543.1 MAG: homogentisate 1,2-dioxygenase [Legionella sp.]
MYLAGFGNHHQTEAIPGALPKEQNSPQQCPLGLYAEQLSGSAFTRPRHLNLHSWLYRTLPSVVHGDYAPYLKAKSLTFAKDQAPNPLRWSPLQPPTLHQDFVDGLFYIAGNNIANAFIYQCNQSMKNRYFSNSDGEMLIVPYLGEFIIYTEFGQLAMIPGKIAVIPRGIKFKIELSCPLACGYICENNGTPFTLPQLGPLGANGLANPRHFLYPHALFEDLQGEITLICKYQQRFWSATSNHSPLNVVAWHGNYAPYSYDLSLFNTVNTVSFDHPDPSIFTVLTSESNTPGVANLDFVIFPPRWMVAEHSFRPPYYHRNIMSELMGLVYGEYDAKKEGFVPGGVSIHNCMTAHGPDTDAYRAAINQELTPMQYKDTLAFMFETRLPWLVSEEALSHPFRQVNYSDCWQGLAVDFAQMNP